MAGKADSTLLRAADIALLLPPAPEACSVGLAPTTSTTMTLAQAVNREAPEVVSGPKAGLKYAVEAIGTFFLVFTVGAAVGSASRSPRWVSVRS